MISLKRAIAASIVCFKPHVLLTLCILLVIAQSIIVAIQKGTTSSTSNSLDLIQTHRGNDKKEQNDLTLTMTTIILAIALIWALFFVSVIRFELRNEVDSLLILFQSSKRGLRFLGVVFFHVIFLLIVAFLVSSAVEKSSGNDMTTSNIIKNKNHFYHNNDDHLNKKSSTARFEEKNFQIKNDFQDERLKNLNVDDDKIYIKYNSETIADNVLSDRLYLMRIYKIWLTAIVYAFLYLIVENIIMFYVDMSLIEFIHGAFLYGVAKLTGIDLSDYPAGEMLFNPLVRRIFR